jgi:hypothetical protein
MGHPAQTPMPRRQQPRPWNDYQDLPPRHVQNLRLEPNSLNSFEKRFSKILKSLQNV